MKPFSAISIGDVYASPFHWTGSKITYTVVSKDKESKLIELRSSYQHLTLPETTWKKPSNRIFSRLISKGSITYA